MTPLEYARRFIFFWKDSPIHSEFDERKYPMISAPLMALNDIDVKDLIVFGATQTVKSVLLEIATAYRLDICRKTVLAVAQTDDDAREFAKEKLNPFLARIEGLSSTCTSKQTLSGWTWALNSLIISGPGLNAQNSKSACYVHTDESHLWCYNNPGAMAALGDRSGLRWDRQQLDTTTAPDAGTECDIRFGNGRKNEFHLGCIRCGKLIWPLWLEASREAYNGVQVFQWDDNQSETAMIDSLRFVCPHCDREIKDTRHNRVDMDEGAAYVPMNPNPKPGFDSYRWNAFSPRWKAWRDLFGIYLGAIASAKNGDLKPYENWVKKQEVRSWTGQFPTLGDSTRGRNYSLGEIPIEVIEPDTFRTCSADQQEKGGFHLWVQIDIWHKDGSSKRLWYGRCTSYADMELLRLRFKVDNQRGGLVKATAIDYGQGVREREIFSACGRYKWLAMKSSDEASYGHSIRLAGQQTKIIQLPFSEERLEFANIGKQSMDGVKMQGAGVPAGCCVSRMWSKPVVYGLMFALKNGVAEREYGVAKDIAPEYIEGLHSYMPGETKDPVTHLPKPIRWIKVAENDHSFITSCQSLTLAVIAGFYPLAKPETKLLQPR